jgi:hypothetical protein
MAAPGWLSMQSTAPQLKKPGTADDYSDDSTDYLHECSGCGEGWDPPEGGEIRVEVVNYPDGTATVAMQALFFEGQTPAIRPLDGIELGRAGCADWTSGDIFDNGPTPEAQTIADSRTYVDKGASITLRQGTTDHVLDRRDDTADYSSFLLHDQIYLKDVVRADMEVDATYEVLDLPLTDGLNSFLEEVDGPPSIIVPRDFTITPSLTNDIEIPTGSDFTFTTDVVAADGDGLFVAFTNNDPGSVDYQCIELPISTGDVIIPSAVIDAMGDTGGILIGTFQHNPWILEDADGDNRRIDVLGVNCYFGTYTKTTP